MIDYPQRYETRFAPRSAAAVEMVCLRHQQPLTCRFGNPRRVVKLFKSPEGHPNGLENTKEGIVPARFNRTHGFDWPVHPRGQDYYGDADIVPSGKPSDSPSTGYICRIDM
jgi:hypothetical protein